MRTIPDSPAFVQPWFTSQAEGLTKREVFAAMAMQGLLSDCACDMDVIRLAGRAAEFADALIAELNEP